MKRDARIFFYFFFTDAIMVVNVDKRSEQDMDYMQSALKMKEYAITVRRYLHEHPELSGREENTVSFLDGELTKFGVEHVIVPERGILCFIRGKGEKNRAAAARRYRCTAPDRK